MTSTEYNVLEANFNCLKESIINIISNSLNEISNMKIFVPSIQYSKEMIPRLWNSNNFLTQFETLDIKNISSNSSPTNSFEIESNQREENIESQQCLLETPNNISKHCNYITGGQNVDILSTTLLDLQCFFGPGSKIISSKINKQEVSIRQKIEVPIDTIIKIDSNINFEELYKNFDIEEQYITRFCIIESHVFINSIMIEILIKWIIKVHLKYECISETLYLTVHLIKEYLHRVKNLKCNQLQLLGITCFFIASKYEEKNPPKIGNIIYTTNIPYNKKEIVDFEIKVLTKLNFNLTVPTTYTFLCRYLRAGHADKQMVQLACYISEKILNESQYYLYLPSELAASVVYLSRKITKRNSWSNCLTYHTNYSKNHISKIAAKMEISCLNDYRMKNIITNLPQKRDSVL